ncbi:MAG: TlpA disulfide reductase family protein [Bryobacteraceae bacterium]
MKIVYGLLLAMGLTLQAAAPVPRPAGEFKIHEPSGRDTLLSSQKGKVVVIQFLFTWCPHCQVAAKWVSKMQQELGSKGLVTYGVAFNDEVQTKSVEENNKVTAAFSQYASFPVGLSTKEPVLRFLGLSVLQGYGVPQFVVIDRKGVIRAQTTAQPSGTASIATESVMRDTVNKLLLEK